VLIAFLVATPVLAVVIDGLRQSGSTNLPRGWGRWC